MNNKQIQKKILKIIKSRGGETSMEDIGIGIGAPMSFPNEPDIYTHNFSLLFDKKKIVHKKYPKGFVRLTPLGEQEFDPRHQKVWRFFKDDMAKILSIVATFLSIVATVLSISLYFKE